MRVKAGHRSRTGSWSQALEDHALAQRPRADLQLRRGRRCPCTPRRPARPARSGGCGSGTPRAGRRGRSGGIATSLGIHSRSSASGSTRGHERAVRRRRRAADPRERAERLRRRGRPVRRARRAAGDRRRGRSRRGSSRRSSRTVSSSATPPAKCSRASRAAPSGSDHATSGASSDAGRDLQRAAADVEDREPSRRTSRTSGVRRGRSAAPRPRRSAPRWPRRCGRWTWSSTASEFTASRTAEVAKPSMSSQPFSSAIRSASAVNSVSASTPPATPRRARRGARPGAAAA